MRRDTNHFSLWHKVNTQCGLQFQCGNVGIVHFFFLSRNSGQHNAGQSRTNFTFLSDEWDGVNSGLLTSLDEPSSDFGSASVLCTIFDRQTHTRTRAEAHRTHSHLLLPALSLSKVVLWAFSRLMQKWTAGLNVPQKDVIKRREGETKRTVYS